MKQTEIDFKIDDIIGLKVIGITNNYSDKSLTIHFENQGFLVFYNCQIVYDLGIVGHEIGNVSQDAGLGMYLEIKKINLNPDDYLYCTISRDLKDFENKNEIRISYTKFILKI